MGSNSRSFPTGQTQLFVEHLAVSAQGARQLTHVSGYVSHPQWSPDDTSIAFLFVDHATRRPSPMAAENKAIGVIDDLQNTDVQRIAVTNLQSDMTSQLTPSDLYVFEYDWSPNGNQFAYTAAAPSGDDNWYVAQLYTQSFGNTTPESVYKPRFQIALPRWSPDGKSIAFIQGLMSDEGGTGGEIYLVPAGGGEVRDLTPDSKSSPSWFAWLSDRKILFTEFTGGSTSIARLNVTDAAAVKVLWRGEETIRAGTAETSLSFCEKDGVLDTALIRMSWSMLPEVWAGPVAQWKLKKAKTPTLVLVGERDGEAPLAQSIEFRHALRELGVPTRLVIYAGEGHSFNKHADQIDVTVRTLERFDKYLTAN